MFSNAAQCIGHEQTRDNNVDLAISHLFVPHLRTMFSFLSALGYSLFVLDEDNGSMSTLNDADAAVFNNESRSAICLIVLMIVLLVTTVSASCGARAKRRCR